MTINQSENPADVPGEVLMPPTRDVVQSILDVLPSRVAMLDEWGVVVAVNGRWREDLDAARLAGAVIDVGVNCCAVLRDAAMRGIEHAEDLLAGFESLLADHRDPVCGETFGGETSEAGAGGGGGCGKFAVDVRCPNTTPPRWCALRLSRFDLAGRRMVLLTHEDVTRHRRAYDQLRHAAFHDELTGLPNRKLLLEHLHRCVAKAQRDPEQRFAVLFLDLDRFKFINDSLGHARGDELLQATAQRLNKAVRESDLVARCEAIVARLGGDEFTILLDGVTSRVDAERIALRICHALAEPFLIGGQELFITTSIGISLFDGEHHPDATDLLRDADIAMYQAKAEGKGGYQVFAAPMREDVVRRLEVEKDLRRALQAGQMQLHYQPVVSLHYRRIVGFEALVRWDHPTRGVLGPDAFVPVAEEIGVIMPIGRWVLATAMRQLALWHRQFSSKLWMSVNVSSQQLKQGGLVEAVDRVMQAGQIDPRALKLEITESAVLEPNLNTQDYLRKLAARHVHLCLDDFGTGFSSLSHLHKLPIDTLKIDRSFVSRMHENERDEALVGGVVTLALRLGLEVIAEGVETPRQAQMLRRMGAKLAQGYYFSRPMPAEQMTQVLAQQTWEAAETA